MALLIAAVSPVAGSRSVEAATLGGFTITVTVDPPAAAPAAEWFISYACVPPSGPNIFGGVYANFDRPVTVGAIPMGSVCQLQPNARPKSKVGWEWSGPPTVTPSQVVVWGGVPAAFTVTNHATPTAPGAGTGSFSVTQLVYPAAAVAGGSFGLQYGCSNGDGWIIGYIELEYLKTATVRNLPTGTVCEIFQISEPPPKAGWEYTKRDVSPDPFVIGDRDTIYVGAKVYAEWVG